MFTHRSLTGLLALTLLSSGCYYSRPVLFPRLGCSGCNVPMTPMPYAPLLPNAFPAFSAPAPVISNPSYAVPYATPVSNPGCAGCESNYGSIASQPKVINSGMYSNPGHPGTYQPGIPHDSVMLHPPTIMTPPMTTGPKVEATTDPKK